MQSGLDSRPASRQGRAMPHLHLSSTLERHVRLALVLVLVLASGPFLAACFALAAGSALAAIPALTFPPLTGRVVDAADILPAAVEVSLDQKLADLERRSSDQLVVVTLPSLQGTDI